MSTEAFSDRARELVELWNARSPEGRAHILDEIIEDGLLAILFFDLFPTRDETNQRNEFGFALMTAFVDAAVETGGEGDIDIVANHAQRLVDLWNAGGRENRTRVLKEIHKDGLLAIWVFDLLPSQDEGNDQSELKWSLISLFETAQARAQLTRN
jgi:hypothetical protein